MRTSTRQMLKVLYILSWVIFTGVCIEAGSFIINAVFTLVNPAVVKNLWHEADLSDLYQYNHGYFFVMNVFMSIVAVLKACIFYLIIKILHGKKLNIRQPFNKEMGRFIFSISFLALLAGLFSGWGVTYAEWLVGKGVNMPDIRYLHLGGADVWLFMGVTLLVIAQIFKRGMEIQSENELTV